MSAAKKVPPLRFKDFEAGWGCERLGDSFSLREERNFDGRETEILSVVKDVGVIRYSEKGNLGNRAKDDVTQYNIARKGDIVLNSMNAIIGSVGVSRYDGCISPAYYALRPLDKTDPKFWGCWFWRSKTQGLISSRACGMMEIRRKISTSDLLELEVFAPEKAEQTKIGKIINSLEQVIESRSVSYEKLRSLKKAMLEKMFPQAGAKVPEVRFKGFAGEWERKPLGEMVKKRNESVLSGVLPKLEYEDIVSFEGVLKRSSDQLYVEKRGISFYVGDVLFGKLRPYLGNWFHPTFDGVAVGDWWVLKPVSVVSGYLYVLIQSDAFQVAANQSAGSKMPRADWNLVSETLYPIPPTAEEQRFIGAYFRSLDALISARQAEVGKLKDLKKALLDRMFV